TPIVGFYLRFFWAMDKELNHLPRKCPTCRAWQPVVRRNLLNLIQPTSEPKNWIANRRASKIISKRSGLRFNRLAGRKVRIHHISTTSVYQKLALLVRLLVKI